MENVFWQEMHVYLIKMKLDAHLANQDIISKMELAFIQEKNVYHIKMKLDALLVNMETIS